MCTSSWQGYIDNLMADGKCQDAAIVGYGENKGVWAAYSEGHLKNLTLEELEVLVAKKRDKCYIDGVCLGKTKCSLIRDQLDVENDETMDLRTKHEDGGPTYNVCVAKSLKAFIMVVGKEGTHGGILNQKAFDMAKYMKGCGY